MKKFLNWVLVNASFFGIFALGIALDKYGLIVLGTTLNVVFLVLAILILCVMVTGEAVRDAFADKGFNESLDKLRDDLLDKPNWFKILDPLYDIAILIFFIVYDLYFNTVIYILCILTQLLCRGWAATLVERQSKNKSELREY